MRFNKTRKNKILELNNILNNSNTRRNTRDNIKNNICTQYTDGFRRRMTDKITLISYNPTNKEIQHLKKIEQSLPSYSSITDKEINEFVINSHKYHKEYIESVKNHTNIF